MREFVSVATCGDRSKAVLKLRLFLAYLEKLQDQTTQVREAREALDSLRRDYAEQRRREEEEAHRQRQIQMMQKVEVLRQQKRVSCALYNTR